MFQRKDSILSKGRPELYPWSSLTEVGDFFIISESLKPYNYVSAYVSQRNHRLDGEMIYSCKKIPGGTYVSLAYYDGWDPGTLEEFGEDVWVGKAGGGGPAPKGIVEIAEEKRGIRAAAVERETQEKRIARLSRQHKIENLPWWWENGKPVLNSRVMSHADTEKYVLGRKTVPGPNEPYPAHYRLDENFVRHAEEDEDSGEYFEEPEDDD
jgi:hypothetical protein